MTAKKKPEERHQRVLHGRIVHSEILWAARDRVISIETKTTDSSRNRILTVKCPTDGCNGVFKTSRVDNLDKHVCIRCFCSKKTRKPVYHTHWLYLCHDAQKRGHAVELTFEQFQKLCFSRICFYCLSALKRAPWTISGSKRSYAHNFDRMDSGKGYTMRNLVPCCRTCNLRKRSAPAKEWLVVVALRQGRLESAAKWCTSSDAEICKQADHFKAEHCPEI